MTKTFVQHFVENLLKVLKVLKTRTALTRNGLAELRMRSARQGAKAPFKTKEQNQSAKEGYKYITKTTESLKKVLTNNTIEPKKKERQTP